MPMASSTSSQAAISGTAETPAPVIERILRPFQRFAQQETSSGLVLLGCAVIALVWANSPWGASYEHLWEQQITIGHVQWGLTMSLHHWINDGLMAIFFFVVGLEIKRELLIGELSTRQTAALPIAAALGGMVVPALIYAAFNAGTPGARGWGLRWPRTSPSRSARSPCSAPVYRRCSRSF
jgi:Na+:H+ antiporter, NhaA family